MRIKAAQVIKSLIGGVLGGLPGAIWYFNVGSVQSIVIASLGAFVGFALTLPGVSLERVALGTVGAIAARNVHGPMRERILEATMGNGNQAPADDENDHRPGS